MLTFITKVFSHESDLDKYLNQLTLDSKSFTIEGFGVWDGKITITISVLDSIRGLNRV